MSAPPANAVLALIKASRPNFRSLHDKVAFACHAVAAINGLKLVAVGEQADAQETSTAATPEVPVDGWNQRDGEYAFLYMYEPGAPAGGTAGAQPQRITLLLLKCVPVDGTMFVSLMASHRPSTAAAGAAVPAPQQQPETLELDVRRCAVPEGVDAADTAASLSPAKYGQLQELVFKVQAAIDNQLAVPVATSSNSGRAAASTAAAAKAMEEPSTGSGMRGEAEGRPERSPLLADPYLGDEDRMPTGDPLMIGGPRRGGMPGGPMGGGGMHVGPEHPMFADRMRHPGLAGRGPQGPFGPAHPAGARWDPIAPEGLQGWNPEDFQRGRQDPRFGPPPVHPDIMQPGAGRGTDWDHMFG